MKKLYFAAVMAVFVLAGCGIGGPAQTMAASNSIPAYMSRDVMEEIPD